MQAHLAMSEHLAVLFYRWRTHAIRAHVRGTIKDALHDLNQQEAANRMVAAQLQEALDVACRYKGMAEAATAEAREAKASASELVDAQTGLMTQLEDYDVRLRDALTIQKSAEQELQDARLRNADILKSRAAHMEQLQVDLSHTHRDIEALRTAAARDRDQVCNTSYIANCLACMAFCACACTLRNARLCTACDNAESS